MARPCLARLPLKMRIREAQRNPDTNKALAIAAKPSPAQLQRMLGNRRVARLIQRHAGHRALLELLRRKDPPLAVFGQIARQAEKGQKKDFAVLLDPSDEYVAWSKAMAPGSTVLHATNVDDLVKQLKAVKEPIGTLFFFAHMNEDGDILFTPPGKMDFVPAETVASKIKDSVHVDAIDLRGCSVAQSPAAISKIKVAVQATKITGATCTIVKQVGNPVKVNGKEITTPGQLSNPKIKNAFDDGFKKMHELFTDQRKKCIVNDSVDGYFKTGGRLVAVWANPGSMANDTDWDDKKSVCFKDLKTEKVDPAKPPVIGPDDCKLIEVSDKK
ncbi:MAG: hypothetical protein ABR874_22310 [Candidatus Sulfotelmatobacter sp.]|jgi:hypothetical protein